MINPLPSRSRGLLFFGGVTGPGRGPWGARGLVRDPPPGFPDPGARRRPLPRPIWASAKSCFQRAGLCFLGLGGFNLGWVIPEQTEHIYIRSFLVGMLAIVGWTAAGAVLGVACECAAWNSWRVVCGSVATGLAGARDWPGLSLASLVFVIFSRLRVVGLTGGCVCVCAWSRACRCL